MNEEQYLVGICAYTEFSPLKIKVLIDHFGKASNVWNLSLNDLVRIGLRRENAEGFVKHKKEFDFENYFKTLSQKEISYISIYSNFYPGLLRLIEDPPLVIYTRGDKSILTKDFVAVIGSRKMTSYGQKTAYLIGRYLAEKNVGLVSGMALGIDASSQAGSIENGGSVVAVLASPLDNITPKLNLPLAHKIMKQGVIISEYPLGYEVKKRSFLERNRIISGMSLVTVVVEGAEKSGTLVTSSIAASQSRSVMAVPGDINSPNSYVPHLLISSGARGVFRHEDIFDEYVSQKKIWKEAVNDTSVELL